MYKQLIDNRVQASKAPRSILLTSITLVAFSGCGFAIAPLEIIALGTLSGLVKEVDSQLAREAETQPVNTAVSQTTKNIKQIADLPPDSGRGAFANVMPTNRAVNHMDGSIIYNMEESIASPALPAIEKRSSIERYSIMPDSGPSPMD